ncbi:hypothetical protein, partial [Enterococcus faecalis]|uniref:hypothetical protein n=1 Tax=Enterococcus faecalis TaxID=1351 RepID=UPI00403F9C4B
RPQFGYRGALLVWLFALVTYVGYTVFNDVVFGVAFQDLTGTALSHGGVIGLYVGFTALATLLAVIGYDLIHMAQRVLAIVVIAALAVFTVGLPHVGGVGSLGMGAFLPLPFLVQLFAAAG